MGQDLSRALGAEQAVLEQRRFPDGETYVRFPSPVAGRVVALVASLDRPDPKIPSVLFALETARELGARSVGLVAPYLCYMRQDRRFHDGEAISARLFARILSRSTDWLATVDPHLHRIHDLADVFEVPARVAHAAPAIAAWIRSSVDQPVLVGPDEESEPWVADVASRVGAPWIAFRKIRRGDRDVELLAPDVAPWRDHTPVLIDDIVSTARTITGAATALRNAGMRAPRCVAVHAVFADGAEEALRAAGVALVTCNTVPHPSNGIDVTEELARCAAELLAGTSG
jgi:ribose-phosphate pyrophosphokinase